METVPTRRAALGLGLAAALLAAAPGRAAAGSAHDFSFPALEGGTIRLADLAGRALLVVNTASLCAFTPQYRGLQALADELGPAGLTVIGVPSDDFRQELGSAAEVRDFCAANYDITFPMTDILPVRGPAAHPFFRWAAEAGGPDAVPRWNFHKLLVATDGRLAAAFPATVSPESPALRAAIRAVLPGGGS